MDWVVGDGWEMLENVGSWCFGGIGIVGFLKQIVCQYWGENNSESIAGEEPVIVG